MSKMKKVFAIIAASISALVIVLLVTLCFIKQNHALEIGSPYKVMVYNRSTTAIDNGFERGSEKYSKSMEKFKEVTNLSIFDWLIHENSLEIMPGQDVDGNYATFSTDMKTEYVAVEMLFDSSASQDIIVNVDGATKVVSFDCIIVILPTNNNYSDIVIYYSLGSSRQDEQYKLCQPIIIKGRAGALVDFANSLVKEEQN